MQIVHLLIVELTNQSLQNHVMLCWLWQNSLLIGRTKILFAFIYKQSMLTSSWCYVTITVMVTVNKYDQSLSTPRELNLDLDLDSTYNNSLRIMTGHEIIIVPCDLIINIQWSVVTSPSNEQEGSLIKCLREISGLSDLTVIKGNI